MKNIKIAELVKQAQSGDKEAMNSLISEIYNDLYYYVLKTVKDENLAADVTQESCIEIITTIDKLQNPEAFSLWSKRIAYHQCTRYFRKTKEVLVEENEDGETIFDNLEDESEDALPEAVAEDKEFRQTIMAMINSLPPEQSNALLLYYYEKMSVGEIAEIQGTTEGTVKSRLNYARKAIKGRVEEYEEKTGTKLHGFAFLPLLLRFVFGAEKGSIPALSVPASVTATATATAATAAMAGTAAGATATGAIATAATATAAKTAGTALATKIIAGVLAASVAIGGIGFGVSKLTDKNKKKIKSDNDSSYAESVFIKDESIWEENSGAKEDAKKELDFNLIAGEWTSIDDYNYAFAVNSDKTITVDGKTSKLIFDGNVGYNAHEYRFEGFSYVLETPIAFDIHDDDDGENHRDNECITEFLAYEIQPGIYQITLINHYGRIIHSFNSNGAKFFRKSDYTEIALTVENVHEYVEIGGYKEDVYYMADRYPCPVSFRTVYDVIMKNCIVYSDLIITYKGNEITKTVSVTPSSDEIVFGDTVSTTPISNEFIVIGADSFYEGMETVSISAGTPVSTDEMGNLTAEIPFTEITEITKVKGKVYVLKGDENDASEESVADAEHTWRIIEGSKGNGYIVIDDSGKLTEYCDRDVYEYTFDYDADEIESGEKVDIYSDGTLAGEISFGYYGNVRVLKKSGFYYYNAADFNADDYDVIELNSENVSQYIEGYCDFEIETTSHGEIRISQSREYKFKEGLGIASYINANLNFRNVHKTAIYNSNTDTVEFGEVIPDDKASQRAETISFCGAGSYMLPKGVLYPQYTDNGDGTYSFKYVLSYEIIGAEDIYGKVYVPKGWNG